MKTTGSHFIGECVWGGACDMLDAVYSTCVNSLIPSKTGKIPSRIKNQHRPLSAGQVQNG